MSDRESSKMNLVIMVPLIALKTIVVCRSHVRVN